MIDKIVSILSNIFSGSNSGGLLNARAKSEKPNASGNTVVNNGNNNTTAIGNNIELSPKIGLEKNAGSDDTYTLCIDTKKTGDERK